MGHESPFKVVQYDIEWQLYAVAAKHRFGTRESAILVEFVRRCTAAAITVVFARLLALTNALSNIFKHGAKFWRLYSVHKVVPENVPEREPSVFLHARPEEFRRIGRIIPITIDAQDSERADLLIERVPQWGQVNYFFSRILIHQYIWLSHIESSMRQPRIKVTERAFTIAYLGWWKAAFCFGLKALARLKPNTSSP